MNLSDFDFEHANRIDYINLLKYVILSFVWNYDYFTCEEKDNLKDFYNSCFPYYEKDKKI